MSDIDSIKKAINCKKDTSYYYYSNPLCATIIEAISFECEYHILDFINKGVINQIGSYYLQYTPLQYAIHANKLVSLKLLLKHNATYNLIHKEPICEEDLEHLPLRIAARNKNYDIMELLLGEEKVKESPCGKYCQNIFFAIENDCEPHLKYYISQGQTNLIYSTRKDYGNYTPIYKIVQDNKLNLLKIILKSNDLIISNPISNTYKCTLLHLAVTSAYIDMVNYMLSFSENAIIRQQFNDMINISCTIGYGYYSSRVSKEEFPLYVAVKNNNLELAKLLLSHNANISMKNGLGNTALHTAAENNFFEMVKLLLLYNANKSIPNRRDLTAFKLVARNVNSHDNAYFDEILELLAPKQLLISKPYCKKFCHNIVYAAYNNCEYHLTTYILDRKTFKADDMIKKYNNSIACQSMTAIEVATKEKNINFIRILLPFYNSARLKASPYINRKSKFIEKLNNPNYSYYSALKIATEQKNIEILELLLGKKFPCANFCPNIHIATFNECEFHLQQYIKEGYIDHIITRNEAYKHTFKGFQSTLSLHYAVLNNKIFSLKYLLFWGANTELEGSDRCWNYSSIMAETPLQAARRLKNDEIIEIFDNYLPSIMINEQSNLMLSLYKSKIRTPYIIIEYFGDFMMDVKYHPPILKHNDNFI
jgi:ankyrin repeat protein